MKKRKRLSCEYESVDNNVVGIQGQVRTEYCLRIQRAVEYKGNGDHEDIPSILKDYENLILSRLSVATERGINAVKEFAEKLKEICVSKRRFIDIDDKEEYYFDGAVTINEIDELLKEYGVEVEE